MTTDVLRLDSISKAFGSVQALSEVSLNVRAGEVHALVGENGAGKSTLMGIAAGALAPDRGTVEIVGRRLSRVAPGAAQELGLAVVYQHATTLDDLTVRENLLLSLPAGQRRSTGWVREQLDRVGCLAKPGDRVEELGPAQRQLVEIARALALDSRVLVLDEPTESLTESESELLFAQIDRLRSAGAGIVYISHRFAEVRRVADRISVLRDGRMRGTFEASSVSQDDVLELIVGREVDLLFPPRPEPGQGLDGSGHPAPAPVLTVRGLSGSRFRDVTLDVAPGEIVGLAGVEGNGQRDFLRALAGLGGSSGDYAVAGRAVGRRSPRGTADSGVVYLPGDRHAEGVLLPMSVRENVSVLALDAVSRGGLVDQGRERAMATAAVASLSIRTPDVEAPVAGLSGGNQQKVLFARSLQPDPTVLLADEPTRGVDVGARAEIYRILREFAGSGKGVVALSSDAIELAGLCDRVLVFSRGHVVRELSGDELTERAITGAAIGARTVRAGAATAAQGWRTRLGRLGAGDYAPTGVLALLMVLLAFVAWSSNPLFLSTRNLSGTFVLASVLALVAVGQLTTLLAGSIDLSVGPLVGLVIVVMSFFAVDGAGTGGLLLGTGAAVLVGAVTGLLNGLGVRLIRLPPVVATLVTYIVLQGLALLLRPTPAGYIDADTISLIQTKVGPFPVVFLLTVLVVVGVEWLLRRTRGGQALRAVGSDEVRARRLGVPVDRTIVLAHVLCSVATALGAVVLCSLVGVGQAGVGTTYTLTSIAAVVLGGASIFGGRGSYVGALFGAVLIQEITSATSFLDLDQAWQEWLPGLLVLLGAAAFSGARRRALARSTASFAEE